MPNPTGSGLPNEANYAANDETVLDNVTCLEWQKEQPGELYDWQASLEYCDALVLGEHDDWRLPTRIEVSSIMDFSRYEGIDIDAFGHEIGFLLTASTIASYYDPEGITVWGYYGGYSGGTTSPEFKSDQGRLLCVRGGGNGEAPDEPAVPPPDQYSEVALGEIRDNYTGLIWQQGISGASVPFDQAAGYCATLGLGGNVWRVPSIRELTTLVDETRARPAINADVFPGTVYDTEMNAYWASHRSIFRSEAAFALDFSSGITTLSEDLFADTTIFADARVRCVR